MKVYLVQRLTWMFNDVTYEVSGDYPVKAFLAKEEAAAYCAELEERYRNHAFLPIVWDVVDCFPPWEDKDGKFEFFEVVEAELDL